MAGDHVYTAVYKARSPNGPGETAFSNDFFRSASLPNSYYDGGDDPSFFSAERLKGPVTWGVCRPPLRRQVNPRDVVAFVAMKRTQMGIDYFLKGFATVDRKVSQLDIWQRQELQLFRRYLNLLIRPKRGSLSKYRWYEPADRHEDWLWRICEPNGHSKEEFDKLAPDGIIWPGRTRLPDGAPVSVAANYVIFSNRHEETTMLSQPVHIASAPPLREARMENWMTDQRSQVIKSMIIGAARTGVNGSRGLKTRNAQTAHPHLALDLVTDAAKWRHDMRRVLGV